MRILITSPIFPPDLGGPSTYVPSLAAHLAERGHDVTVIAFSDHPAPSALAYRVVAIPRRVLPLRYLHSLWRTWREAGRCDVLYVNEHLALAVVLAGRLRRVPIAIRVMVDGAWEVARRYGWHADTIDEFQAHSYGARVVFVRRLQRRWWRWCDALVVPSRYLLALVEAQGVAREKLHLISNAYHGPRTFEMTRAEARRELAIAEERVVVICIARLELWKGIDGLLRALQRLPAHYELFVIGDGEERGNWTRLARELGVAERAHFVGAIAHERVPLWIRACDAFVLNTRYEGLSHTLLEVMTLGAPAAVSRVCSNPELVEHEVTGLLFEFHDADAITSAIRRLVEDRASAERFLHAARERAREFDRGPIFERTEQLLGELADQRMRASSATRRMPAASSAITRRRS